MRIYFKHVRACIEKSPKAMSSYAMLRLQVYSKNYLKIWKRDLRRKTELFWFDDQRTLLSNCLFLFIKKFLRNVKFRRVSYSNPYEPFR